MTYLPYENITYKTRLTEDELFKRLEDATEPAKIRFGLFGKGTTKTYEGEINRPSFAIRRIIQYQNSFLPRIKGTIENDFGGTRIHVKMRLHPFVVAFLFIWCSGAVLGCVLILTQDLDHSLFSLIPFVMLVFCYALTLGAFKFESVPTKKALQKLFEAEMVEE